MREDGSSEWLRLFVPEGESIYEWQYSKELRAVYHYSEDGNFSIALITIIEIMDMCQQTCSCTWLWVCLAFENL
jgi:hypothetical protein